MATPPWKTRLAQAAARLRADLAFALIDAVIVVFAYTAALVLRFIDIQSISSKWWQGFLIVLPIVLVVHLTANLIFGAYGHVWEFASVEEAMRLVAAAVTFRRTAADRTADLPVGHGRQRRPGPGHGAGRRGRSDPGRDGGDSLPIPPVLLQTH